MRVVGCRHTLNVQLAEMSVSYVSLSLRSSVCWRMSYELNSTRLKHGGVAGLKPQGFQCGSARLNLWHAEAYHVGCVKPVRPVLGRLSTHYNPRVQAEAAFSECLVHISVAICSTARERGLRSYNARAFDEHHHSMNTPNNSI
jgi:hypothetical protein